MSSGEQIDLCKVDFRTMTLEEREALKREVIRRAGAERNAAIRAAFLGIWRGLRKLWALPRCALDAYRARRQWKITLAELRGLDERALRDIGLSRLDVTALAHNRGRTYGERRGAR